MTLEEELRRQREEQRGVTPTQFAPGIVDTSQGAGLGGFTLDEQKAKTDALTSTNDIGKGLSSLDALSTNREDLYNQQMDLAIKAQRDAWEQQQQSLNRQLEEQRRNMQRGRQVLSEQGFMGGRNLLSSLARGGLATSGLMQLGDVQRGLAQGQSLNQMLQTGGQQVGAIEQQRRAGETGFANTLSGLELQRAQGIMGIQEAAEAKTTAQTAASAQAFRNLTPIIADPNIPQAIKDQLIRDAGLTPEQVSTLGTIGDIPQPAPGVTPGEVPGLKVGGGELAAAAIAGPFAEGLRDKLPPWLSGALLGATGGKPEAKYRLNIGGTELGFDTPEEVKTHLRQTYRDIPGIDKVDIGIKKSALGDRIEFKVDNQTFNTIEEAANYLATIR